MSTGRPSARSDLYPPSFFRRVTQADTTAADVDLTDGTDGCPTCPTVYVMLTATTDGAAATVELIPFGNSATRILKALPWNNPVEVPGQFIGVGENSTGTFEVVAAYMPLADY
jgi:hypothetical protein